MEQEKKTPEQEWKDFMPPDNFVPEWKKQWKAMEHETSLKKTAERAAYAALGAAIATGVSFLSAIPHLAVVQLSVLGVFLLTAAVTSYTSLRMRLRAIELDHKLDEDIRVEPEPKKPYVKPEIRELAPTDDKARALSEQLKA